MNPVRSDGRLDGKRNPWLLAVAVVTLLLIWGQSVLPVSGSARESGWLLETIVNPTLRFLGFADMSQTLLRKLAHITEFALLSFWLVLLLRGNLAVTLVFGFIAAALDESIQLFSDRSAEVYDIWIDFIGVIAGSLLGVLFHRTAEKRAARKRAGQG